MAVMRPMLPFMSNDDSDRIENPMTRMIEVTISARPTEEKA